MEINFILNIILLLIIFILLIYIVHIKKFIYKSFNMIDKMLDNALENKDFSCEYNESSLSKIEFKTKNFISVNLNLKKDLITEKDNITSLISDISHQTKTPLSNILIYSELLEDNYNKEYLSIVLSQCKKLNFLIDNLIKSSRFESDLINIYKTKEDISSLINLIIFSIANRLDNKKIIFDEKNIVFEFDYKWTEEAILNIIDNAIKYSYENTNIYINLSNTNNFIKIDIISTGDNISEEDYAKIFKRFYRNQSYKNIEGLGIGLYLSRKIIELQNGYITVNSKNHINTFSIYLPINTYKTVSI